MTRHPDELLAAYVDGALDAADRRAVDRHVRSCATCRAEVETARRAREALASLPEEPSPEGLVFRVLGREDRAPASGRVWRIATAAGIAASLILGAVVLFQRLDLGTSQTAAEDAGRDGRDGEELAGGAQQDSAAGPTSAEAFDEATGRLPLYRPSNARYASEDMPRVLSRLRQEAAQLLDADSDLFRASLQTTSDGRASTAAECAAAAIRNATQIEDPGVPFVLERASFYDTFAGEYVPGYVAAYVRDADVGQRPTTLLMAVVDRETCARLLYYTSPVEL